MEDCLFEHAFEHVVRKKLYVFREHAKDQAVDEVSCDLWIVSALAQPLSERRKFFGDFYSERLTRFSGTQRFWVAEN